MELERACAFTGHRPADLPGQGDLSHPEAAALYARLQETVESLYQQGIREFYCGGAQGFDTWAAQAVLELKGRKKDVHLRLLIPFWGQEASWPEASQREYERIRQAADVSHVLSGQYYKGCMQARNRQLVEQAGTLVAYCVKDTGGSAYTLAYAQKKGRRVIRLDDSEEQMTMQWK